MTLEWLQEEDRDFLAALDYISYHFNYDEYVRKKEYRQQAILRYLDKRTRRTFRKRVKCKAKSEIAQRRCRDWHGRMIASNFRQWGSVVKKPSPPRCGKGRYLKHVYWLPITAVQPSITNDDDK